MRKYFVRMLLVFLIWNLIALMAMSLMDGQYVFAVCFLFTILITAKELANEIRTN